jgi:hypothetical protein
MSSVRFTNHNHQDVGLILLTLGFLFALELEGAESVTPSTLHLTAPRDYQVHQRVTRDEGTMIVTGSLASAGEAAVRLAVRLIGKNAAAIADWQKVADIKAGAATFRGAVTAPSGGWYRLEARAMDGAIVVAHGAVEHVGVGEIFVIAGQSNSANYGGQRKQTKTRLVATFHNGKWQLSNDPQPGASGAGGSFIPSFGDAMVERFEVPVGIIATGVGGTSVREWLPRGTQFPNPPTITGNVRQLGAEKWESKGRLFDRFVARMQQAGLRGFRAVLWHQGESDANQRDASRTLAGGLYRQYLEQLIQDSRRELGWNCPWFVALVSYHTPDDPASPEIRAAQRGLWQSGVAQEGPDSDALTEDYRSGNGKGVHFNAAGLREHGLRWAHKVSPWLEQELLNTSRPKIVPKSNRAHKDAGDFRDPCPPRPRRRG